MSDFRLFCSAIILWNILYNVAIGLRSDRLPDSRYWGWCVLFSALIVMLFGRHKP